jgi:aspartate carbamoyltransferase catalytic subunit
MSDRHLLASRHLSREDAETILSMAQRYRDDIRAGKDVRNGAMRMIGLLFFEPSTRTRVSFERACTYLGYHSTNFSSSGSSMGKGETLKDTILTLKHERLDALVVRHPSCGSPKLVADYFGGPVINAGDGEHEHPTQALGDALTILQRKGKIEGLTVAIVGDVMHSRVARTNAWMLTKLGAKVRFVGPRTLLPVSCALLPGEATNELAEGLEGADVVMCLRLQKERMTEGLMSSVGEYRRGFQVNSQTLKYAHGDAIVMHPGPMNRGVELDDATADGPQSVVLDQVENCIYARTAVLQWVFDRDVPPQKATGGKKK